MNDWNLGKQQRKCNIATRFRNINMLLLLVILVVVSMLVVFMLFDTIEDISADYARFYSVETVEKFGMYINKDLALVRKVSHSNALKTWFADESNTGKKEAAFNEIMDYVGIMQSAHVYFGIHKSLNLYPVGKETTFNEMEPNDTLSPDYTDNSWYFTCVNSENEYTLAVDVDKVSQARWLWIKHKVSDNGRVIGAFCSALPFDEVMAELFSHYYDENVRGLVIDKNGLIQMDSSLPANSEFLSNGSKQHIQTISADPAFVAAADSYLADINGLFAMREEPQVIKLGNSPYKYVSIAPIANTDWSVVTFFNSASLFSAMRLLPLLLVALSAFVLYTVLGNALIRRFVLTPLKRLTNSVSALGDGEGTVYGSDRNDEFGELAQTIQYMHGKLNVYNAEMLETAHERDRQSLLMHAVNSTATVLLTADENSFKDSLKKGMELMARCIDVDRVNIWQNEMKDNDLHYVKKFAWVNADTKQGLEVGLNTSFSYDKSMREWWDVFARGECVNGPIKTLSHNEYDILQPFGVKSVLAIPVHLQEHAWGFVSFDDCHQERVFTEDEINILRSASLMMVSAMYRNEAAAKMREADERAKLMLDATPLCCNLWDKDFNNIDCNEEAVKLFDLKNKQEYLDRFFEFSPEYQPDGQPSAKKALRYIMDAFECGRTVFEWMHQKLDGTPIPSEITLVRMRHGEDYIVTGYTRDLREYKKMIGDIERRDELLHTMNIVANILLQSELDEFDHNLWECMGLMAEAVEADRVYIWKNDEKDGRICCTRLYEWTEGSEPQQCEAIADDMPYSKNVPGWEQMLSGGQCINGPVSGMSQEEQAQLSPQGILSILVVPIFIRDKFWGFMGFDDCHQERHFSENEESILRSGSLLIGNALLRNEMTLSIRTAVEDAQAASRAKSNFLSNMSHEMRTPMNAIIGMTKIGQSAADLERKDYAFGKIGDASKHLLGVINDILDMSKIEANKFDLSEVEFSFEKVLQNVVNVISFRIDEKHQRFDVYLDKDIPQRLIGDDQRLAQVITNLLSNAVKFTPEGGSVRLGAHLVQEDDGICTVQVDVTDTGIGINEEQQSRLFNSFEQAESSTSRKFGGTGLGLAISKRIVELMGGHIWVESAMDKGSTFSFTMKVRRGITENCDLLSPGVDWAHVRLLAVDDEEATRDYFAHIAGQLNISCDTASCGREALEMISSRGPYDIYFVDWKMPGMNGIELSRRIKELEADKSVIVMISATEWNEIEAEAKAAGVYEFLPKPLFPSAIAGCINKCLGTASMPEQQEREEEAGSFKGYRVLLAEDMEINREIVLSMLEATQLDIDCAGNGIEAVQMFLAMPERYDMIFMDVQMPEMDGLEATRRIRELNLPTARTVPIVAMTANVFREDVEACLSAGMNDHVGKPLDFDDVLSKLRYYLKQIS